MVADDNSTSTVITGKTQDVGTFAMTTIKDKLYLGLTAADMAKEISASAAKTYWAKETDAQGEGITSNYEANETYHKVSNLELTGGDEGVKYQCTIKYTVTLTGIEAEDKTKVQAGDGILNLRSTGTVQAKFLDDLESLEEDLKSAQTSETFELSDLVQNGAEFYLVYDFTGSKDKTSGDLEASFGITNRKDDQPNDGNQNYLAGKTLTLRIESSKIDGEKLDCHIVQPSA